MYCIFNATYNFFSKTNFQSWWQYPAGVDLLRGVPACGQAGRGAERAGHLLDGRQRGGGGARLGHHPPPGATHSSSAVSQCYCQPVLLSAKQTYISYQLADKL